MTRHRAAVLFAGIHALKHDNAELRHQMGVQRAEMARIARERSKLVRQLDDVASHTFEPNP